MRCTTDFARIRALQQKLGDRGLGGASARQLLQLLQGGGRPAEEGEEGEDD